jgi:serine/threonine protein kinase
MFIHNDGRQLLTCIPSEMPHEHTLNANTGGYTKAVDLWSLGCVTVVLLTGGYPFFEPGSTEYSEKLASACNLEALEKSQTWQDVGARPKAFVRRLLVLDERQRMTAGDSLTHEWFTNDVHRTDFEELYRRAIRHWRPRMPKAPVIELIEADNLKSLPFLQGISPNNQKGRRRGPVPIDPPYKPFPRRLHNQAFFPKRRNSPFNNTLSDDVKAAIERDWKFDKSHSTGSSLEEEELPKPYASEVGKGSDNSSTDDFQDRSVLPSPTSLPNLSKKPRFQPLRPKVSLTSTNTMKASESNGSEAKSTRNVSDCAKSEGKAMVPVRKAYSPNAWEKEAGAINSTPKSKARLTLPNRPVTPKPHKPLSNSNRGPNLSLPPWNNAKILHSSMYFAQQSSCGAVKQMEHEKDRLADRQSLRQENKPLSSDQEKRADHLVQSLSEAIQDRQGLNSEPSSGSDCSHSFPDVLQAFSVHEVAPIDAIRPETATIGLRLKSPTHSIGNVVGIRSSNIKKRRSRSIFDFEEDATDNAPGQSKKAKFDQEIAKRNGKPISVNAAFRQTKPKPVHAGSTGMEVEKTLGQTNHTDDLYLPRI